MKVESFLLALIFGLTPLMWAQEPQAPPPGGSQAHGEHRQQMMEIHQQEMEAMKVDIQKMKSALAQIKANLLTIKDVRIRTLAKQRGSVGILGRPHGADAEAHGVPAYWHKAAPHGWSPFSFAGREET